MKYQGQFHLIKSAFGDFRRNRVRTFLTSLGIMIGVLSVVMLIALGLGLKNFLKQQFESLGTNLIMIMPGSGFSGEGGLAGMGPGLVSGIKLDERDVVSLQRISGIEYLVPVFFKAVTVEVDGEEEFGYLFGASEDIFKAMNLEPAAGEVFTKSDVAARAKKAVMGQGLAEKLFDEPEDAIGRTARVSEQRFKIIGVAEKISDNETNNAIITPYKTTFGSLNPDKTFFSIYLGVADKEDVPRVKQEAEETLLKRYDEDDFSVTEQTEILSVVNAIFNMVNTVLVAIASISLIVGGIGIMNIMYATVTERTKEVGIRRAVGATQQDILLQFLTESVILSVCGGLAGLLLATLIVLVVRPFFPLAINFLAVVAALGVSSAIGIFFGVFPARRAAKLPPIEAIRYE